MDVNVNIANMNEQTRKALEGIVDDYSFRILKGMEVGAPVRKGMLRYQIGRQFTVTPDKVIASIRSGAPYTEIVERGSRPHTIEAVRAKALRFVVDGVVRFAKSVQHPGTKPTFFIQKSVQAANGILPLIVKKHMEKVGKIIS